MGVTNHLEGWSSFFGGELLVTFSRHFEEKFSAAGAVVAVFVEGWERYLIAK